MCTVCLVLLSHAYRWLCGQEHPSHSCFMMSVKRACDSSDERVAQADPMGLSLRILLGHWEGGAFFQLWLLS